MMIPVNIDEVLVALTTARNLYEVGFSKVTNTTPRYRDFGQDIRNLAINLDILSGVVDLAQREAGSSLDRAQIVRWTQANPPVPGSSILAGLQGTLRDCEILLDDQRYFQKSGGYVGTVNWYYQIDPEVQKLRNMITCHNTKLSIVFKVIDSRALGDRSFYIHDATESLHREAEQLGRQVRDVEEAQEPSYPSKGLPPFVMIPPELDDSFMRYTLHACPDLKSLTLDGGIDSAVLHFTRIVQVEDQANQVKQAQTRYLSTLIAILMASWMVQTLRASREYEIAAKFPSVTAFERQMDTWGMTIDRFIDMFEEELQKSLRHLLGRDLLLPPTPDLLQIFEKERPMQPVEIEAGPVRNIPRQEQRLEELHRGTKLMNVDLKSYDPNYTLSLQVYRQTEKRSSLVLISTPISEGRERETTDNYDLCHVEIIPSYALRTWTAPSMNPNTIVSKTDAAAPFSRTLVFQRIKDLLDFQFAITGYKVKHDDSRVLATSQESKLLGGSRRQDLCRLQIWAASVPAEIPRASPRPTNNPSQSSSASSSSAANQSRRRTSSPSIFSSKSRASFSSRASISVDAPSLPGLGTGSSKSEIHIPPISPCIVLFAHRAPSLSAKVEGRDISRSFLVIDITPEVTIEEELSEHDHEQDPSYRCVLENKSSYLQARRSIETRDPKTWNLASVGVHKRERETEAVKKLKHVILEFDTRQNLSEFTTKFKQVKDIATYRLAKFVQATGT